jgi:hypothetical protein
MSYTPFEAFFSSPRMCRCRETIARKLDAQEAAPHKPTVGKENERSLRPLFSDARIERRNDLRKEVLARP